MPKILAVDSGAVLSPKLLKQLGLAGYEVVGVASSGGEALRMAGAIRPDLVLMDPQAQGEPGAIAAAESLGRDHDLPVIFLTASLKKRLIEKAKKARPYAILSSPIRGSELIAAIEVALLQKEAERRIKRGEESLRSVVEGFAAPVCRLLPDRTVSFANDAFCRAVGRPLDEIVGWSFAGLLPGPEGERIEEALLTLTPRQASARVNNRAGETRKDAGRGGWLGRAVFDEEERLLEYQVMAVEAGFPHDLPSDGDGTLDIARALLNATNESSVLVKPDGEIVAINEMAAQRLGGSAEELAGENFFHLLPPDLAEYRRARLEQVVRTGEKIRFEDEREGRYYDNSIHPVFDFQGTVSKLVFYSSDITNAKLKEEALELEQQRLFHLLDRLPGVVFVVTPDYTIRFANLYFRELFGEPGDNTCHEIIWGRKEPCKECHAFRVFGNKMPVAWKWTGLDGRTYQLYNYPFTDVDGSPLAMELGVDITHLAKVETELRMAGEFRDKIINSITEPLAVINPKTYSIVQANENFMKRVGRDCPEVLDRACHEVIFGLPAPCEEEGAHHCPVRETARIKTPTSSDRTYQDSSGATRTAEVTTYPLLDSRGEVELVVRMERDVTDERKVEEILTFRTGELEKTRLKLETIFDVPNQMAKRGSLAELLSFVSETTRKIFPDSDSIFFILDAEGREFLPLKGCEKRVVEPLFRLKKSLKRSGLDREFIQYLSRVGEPQVISSQDRRNSSPFFKAISRIYQSWFGVPIMARNSCIGFFLLGSNTIRDFLKEDLSFFSALFGQLAEVIRGMVLHEARVSHAGSRAAQGRDSYEDLIGRSKKMQEVYELIDLVSSSDATVLITGENGTGKELVARAIHKRCSRSSGPFVVANCSAYSPTLLESELFGHEKGAFTGAIRQKKGRLERASGGTLFLDEIGDIAPATQVMLLRFLQDHTFERVGGEKTIEADVRVLAATNLNLYREVEAGRFREDLYYRLNVVSIHLPALKERKEDIPLLAGHFLKKYNLKEGKSIQRFGSKAYQALMYHDWPGNVRQLENAISHAVIVAQGETIRLKHLPRFLKEGHEAGATTSLFENEKRLIMKVLRESGWNKHEAARRLEVSRSTLYSKIRRYGLKPETTTV